jgi:4-aminobutyrate aminotransferase
MCGIDVLNRKTGKPDGKRRQKILVAAFERGLILLGCGEAGIRVCPPLCINEGQLDIGLRLMEDAITAVA